MQIEIGASYGVGAKMGVIEHANKVSGEGQTEIKHQEGQVILLDFWATWCPPCQKPMGHNQEMLDKRGSDWGDKVRLIGLSIDNDVPTVKTHVQNKGWNSVEHYHVRNGKCTADKDYGVQGVPHVLLVDTTGTIVFIGHPANRPDLEGDIDKLLKGEKITGAGTTATGGEAEGESNAKEMDPATVEAAHSKFQTDLAEFMKK